MGQCYKKNRKARAVLSKFNFRHQKINKLVNLLVFVVIAFGLYSLIRGSGLRELMEIREHLHYKYIIASVFVIAINLFVIYLRWYFLLMPIKPTVLLRNVIFISISSVAVNYSTPGKLGVPAKAFLLKKLEKVDINQSIPSLFAELFLDYGFMFAMLILAGALGGYLHAAMDVVELLSLSSVSFSLLITFLICLAMGIAVLIFWRKIRSSKFFQNLSMAVRMMKARRDYMQLVIFLTFGNLILSFWGDLLLLKGLGVKVPYLFVIFSFSCAGIIGFLSPIAGGVGVREVVNAYLFKLYSYSGPVALMATLLRRILTYIILLLNLLFLKFQSENISLTVGRKIENAL
ncbi:MAG: lysylphosphatidylglycerol synthase transmembrane domain-containing protein [bacterium]